VYHHIANAQTDVVELMDEMISPIELHPTAPDLHQICTRKSKPEVMPPNMDD
jgi:hypothetical protein